MNAKQSWLRNELEKMARDLAGVIDSGLPTGVWFALLLFDLTPTTPLGTTAGDGWITWISNAERGDILKTLQEMVARFRAQELPGYTPSDIEDVAMELSLAAGDLHGVTEAQKVILRRIAAVAIALGASPGLARTMAAERADAADGR